MGSKALASTALLVSLNLLFFSLVSSNNNCPSCTCSANTLKLDACVSLLGWLKFDVLNPPPTYTDQCCGPIKGLVNLEAAACLCTTLRLQPPIVKELTIPVSLQLLLNTCGKQLPCSYQCE